MPNLYVWDFHGTLERDNEYALTESLNRTLRRFGYPGDQTVEDALRLTGKHFRTIYMELTGCTPEQAAEMEAYSCSLTEGVARKHIKPREHAHEVLKAIQGTGDTSILISNCGEDSLRLFLEMVGMENGYFDGRYCTDSDHVGPGFDVAAYKLAHARGHIEREGPFERVRTIGDRESDVELGLTLGAETFLLVPPGRPPPATKAHCVISDLRDFIR